jgi:hypothetical protein
MDIKAVIDGENMLFKDFIVVKESENFYGVYERYSDNKSGSIITSGTTKEIACKKAKLLQTGWNLKSGYMN